MNGMNSGAVCASNNNLGNLPSHSWSGDGAGSASTPIESVLYGLSEDQEKTFKLLTHLQAKLSMIRSPSAETDAKGCPKPVYSTELMRALDARRDTQQAINASIEALLAEIVL